MIVNALKYLFIEFQAIIINEKVFIQILSKKNKSHFFFPSLAKVVFEKNLKHLRIFPSITN
jgi:hypothetical protein